MKRAERGYFYFAIQKTLACLHCIGLISARRKTQQVTKNTVERDLTIIYPLPNESI